jgi:hypothetical protein
MSDDERWLSDSRTRDSEFNQRIPIWGFINRRGVMLSSDVAIKDQLITLNDARKELPGNTGLSTLTRWALKGILIAETDDIGNQNRLRLKTVVVRRVRYTTRQALAEFLTRMGELQAGGGEPRKTPERRQAVQDAPTDDELRKYGLL